MDTHVQQLSHCNSPCNPDPVFITSSVHSCGVSQCPASATHIKKKVLLNVSPQYLPQIRKGNPNIKRPVVTLACLPSPSWTAVSLSCCPACILLPEDLCPALHFLWLLFLPLTSDLSSLIPLLKATQSESCLAHSSSLPRSCHPQQMMPMHLLTAPLPRSQGFHKDKPSLCLLPCPQG